MLVIKDILQDQYYLKDDLLYLFALKKLSELLLMQEKFDETMVTNQKQSRFFKAFLLKISMALVDFNKRTDTRGLKLFVKNKR